MAGHNEDASLRTVFEDGWTMFRSVEDSEGATSSKDMQVVFRIIFSTSRVVSKL